MNINYPNIVNPIYLHPGHALYDVSHWALFCILYSTRRISYHLRCCVLGIVIKKPIPFHTQPQSRKVSIVAIIIQARLHGDGVMVTNLEIEDKVLG